MADVTTRDLKRAARELNEIMGIKPPIDLLADEDGLTTQVKQAAECFEPDDVISDETRSTLEKLGAKVPKAVETKEKEGEGEEAESSDSTEDPEPDPEDPEEGKDPEPEVKPSKKGKEEKVGKKAEKKAKAEKPAKKEAAKETKKETAKKKGPPRDDEKIPAGYVKAEEAAKMLGFDEKRQVRILARKGKLPAKKLESGRVLFKITDLEKYKKTMKDEK